MSLADRMPSFFETLRVHREPFEYVDERAVHDALVARPLGYLDYLHDSLTGIANGRIVSPGRDQPPTQTSPAALKSIGVVAHGQNVLAGRDIEAKL